MSEDLTVAIRVFEALSRNEDRRFWGTSITDAHFPYVETWDIETETMWVILCCADPSRRAEAIKRLKGMVGEKYRNGQFCTGVTVLYCGAEGKPEEIEWTSTVADDEAASMSYRQRDENQAEHVALLKKQGLWRLGEFEERVRRITEGRPDATP